MALAPVRVVLGVGVFAAWQIIAWIRRHRHFFLAHGTVSLTKRFWKNFRIIMAVSRRVQDVLNYSDIRAN